MISLAKKSERRTFMHMSVHPRYLVILVGLFVLAIATTRHVAESGYFLSSSFRTNGAETLEAFEPVTEPAETSVVEILAGNRVVALGTVVSPLGFLVSKASEVGDYPIVRLPDGRSARANVVASDPELDLVLLTVPGVRLTPVRWGVSSTARIGDWVVSPGQGQRSWVGVVSAKRREIKRKGGALGIQFNSQIRRRDGVEITAVFPETPADKAGLRPGDVITALNGQRMTSGLGLIEAIQAHDPGDEVALTARRGARRLSFQVALGFYSIFDNTNRNQMMSGETSDRRNGFSEVIQHAIPLTPSAMGSPLINLRGEAIGINIARADRVTTYAIPAEKVGASVREMIAGLSR